MMSMTLVVLFGAIALVAALVVGILMMRK